MRPEIGYAPRNFFRSGTYAQLTRKDIRRPPRKDSQRNLRSDHPFGDFIDRAIATERQDQVRARRDAFLRNPGRRSRRGSRLDRDNMAP